MEKLVLQILVQFAGTYLSECSGNKVHWIWVFFISFLFCKNVSEFFELWVFFKVLFSRILDWIFFLSLNWQNFSRGLSFNFTFISWEAPFKTKPFCRLKFFVPSVWSPNLYFRLILVLFPGKLHSRSEWRNPSVSYFFLPSVRSSNSHWRFSSSSWQK